jgi:hypothetical protein
VEYLLHGAGAHPPRAGSLASPVSAMHFVEHPEIEDGECYGLAVLTGANGRVITARDGPLLILPRE